jgi:hypothetical protein
MNVFKIGELYSFKLANGQEVIAKIVHHDAPYLTVKQPVTLVHSSQGITAVPPLESGEDLQYINMTSVSMFAPSIQEAQELYTRIVGGIIVPSKRILT